MQILNHSPKIHLEKTQGLVVQFYEFDIEICIILPIRFTVFLG